MEPPVQQPASDVPAVLPGDVVRTPSGEPAVVVARTSRGWTVLGTDPVTDWSGATGEGDALTLVEAMTLADLVAAELGVSPEPTREARRAARTAASTGNGPPPAELPDHRDAEVEDLRRTVGQLEHALAARVSIERAIGVLAERHGTTPREAFEELRRRARAQGRPAQELAAEVLDGLAARATVPDQRTSPALPALPVLAARPAPSSRRRGQRNARPADGDPVPEARS